MDYTIVDLFAGVGGLSLGFERQGFKILLANEYDESIAESYRLNHNCDKLIVSDITRLDIESTFEPIKGKVTVVVGGPPCQGFSQKGQRKTIHDERNFLFKYYVKVVEYLRPPYFVMENVPNLLTAENGYFKNEIINLFNKLGYNLEMGVLNASNYGVPQNRKRAFIIGALNKNAPKLPVPNDEKTTVWDAISDLNFLNSGEGSEEQCYRCNPKTIYQKRMRESSIVLCNHIATNHSKTAIERLKMIPPNCGREMLPDEHITKSVYSGTWTRMKTSEQSVTITTRFDTPSSGKFTHPFLNRAITVREAARIQSFPDTFHFYGTKTSQMKQVGNAVPPLLAECIAKQILNDLRGA